MFSSLHLLALVWVLWWQLVMLYNWLRFSWVFGFVFFMYPFQLEVVPLGRGRGRFSSPHAPRCVCSSLMEFQVWLLMSSALLVQQIPYRAMSLELKAVIRRGSRYACLQRCCAAWAPRFAVGPSSSSTQLGGVSLDVT